MAISLGYVRTKPHKFQTKPCTFRNATHLYEALPVNGSSNGTMLMSDNYI